MTLGVDKVKISMFKSDMVDMKERHIEPCYKTVYKCSDALNTVSLSSEITGKLCITHVGSYELNIVQSSTASCHLILKSANYHNLGYSLGLFFTVQFICVLIP